MPFNLRKFFFKTPAPEPSQTPSSHHSPFDHLQSLIESRLAPALLEEPRPPEALILVGPIGSGKTTLRKSRLNTGYVHIDSADIFHELSNGNAKLDFPDAFAAEIDYIGRALTKEALRQRLSIVIESPGHESEPLIALINALQSIGYAPEVRALDTDPETCERQHAMRGDSVSSYWAAPLHTAWVLDECARLAANIPSTPPNSP